MNKEELRMRMGGDIATLRKKKGFTQRSLAELIGMQRNHIARIEKGHFSVGLDTLGKIAEALNCEIIIKEK